MGDDSSDSITVGVDIGGTHIRIGVVQSGTRRFLQFSKFRTAGLSLGQFCDALEDIVRPYSPMIQGVGIGVPGFCDRGLRRVITTCGTVPFLESCNLAQAVEQRFEVPAWVDNDARAHALGELHFGEWGQSSSFVMLTLGTGVGLAWYVDGRLYPPPDHGAQGGHIAIAPSENNGCLCGMNGCLEFFASGSGLAAAANRKHSSEQSGSLSAENVCALGHDDAASDFAITRAVQAFQRALHTIYHLYFPDLVVVGGGVAAGLWPYLQEVRQWFCDLKRYDGAKNRIEMSHLGDQAGVLGAATLVTGKRPIRELIV